jgi:hypothetical protein
MYIPTYIRRYKDCQWQKSSLKDLQKLFLAWVELGLHPSLFHQFGDDVVGLPVAAVKLGHGGDVLASSAAK